MTPLPEDESWGFARPRVLPEPTTYPATLALGIILLLWGLLSSWIVFGAGLVLFVRGSSGWVGEILREHRDRKQEE